MIAKMTEEQWKLVRQASQLAGMNSAADFFNMKLCYYIRCSTREHVSGSDIVLLYRLACIACMHLEEVLDVVVELIALDMVRKIYIN